MRSRLTLLAVCLAALASACGGSGSTTGSSEHPVDTLAVLGAAAKATDAARSVRMTGTMAEHLVGVTLPTVATPTTVDFGATMAGDLQTHPLLARLTVSDLTTGGQSIPGDVEELLTADAIYMKMPALSGSTGKPWVVMRFADMKRLSGVDLGQMLDQAQQMQPGQYLHQLLASGDVRDLGSATVAGVRTTHYGGVVPLDKVLAQLHGSLRKVSGELMRSAGLTSTHIDVWIDADGLARHLVSKSAAGGNSISIDLTMHAYNVKVDVTPPPPSQVADLAKLGSTSG